MSQISVISFRVNVPTPTPALSPVTIKLEPMSSALLCLDIFASSLLDPTKCGFRLRDHNNLIVPDVGSAESFTPSANGEINWAGIEAAPLKLNFGGRRIDGAPFCLYLDFYNTTGAAFGVAGFISTTQPQYSIHDLVVELQRERAQAQGAQIKFDEHVKQTQASIKAPYPEMEQKQR